MNRPMYAFTDAVDFGFLPIEAGLNNPKALQAAVDKRGKNVISTTETNKAVATAYVGDNTSLIFGNGLIIEKSTEAGRFMHVILNKGVLTRTYNHTITITGPTVRVDNVDLLRSTIYRMGGHAAFFHVKELRIDQFLCFGLPNGQFA